MSAMVTSPDFIRNIALVGHGGCGKTSLAEAMLFASGATTRLGSVSDHSSTLDFEPEEQKRGSSISSSVAWLTHDDCKVNVLDTPGDGNFIYDSFNSMRGADAAVVVVSAPDGVELQTQRVYEEAVQLGLPRAFFINKMDRERADADKCLGEIEATFGVKPVVLQIPIGAESGFEGVISLFQRKMLVYSGETGEYEKRDLPKHLVDEVDGAWESVVEAVASTNDDLLEIYLDTFELSPAQVRSAFHAALKKGEIVPVIFGAATNCIGVASLLDLITWAFPSPSERSPLSGTNGEDLVEVQPSPDAPFMARVIHTMMDEFSGKTSILRIYSGTVPSDHTVQNVGQEGSERLGSMFALRGKDRTQLPIVQPGDIVGVAKLKNSHTGDTLSAPGNTVLLDPVVYPASMMSYVIKPVSKGDADKLRVGVDRLVEEDPTLTLSIDGLTHQMVLSGMGQAHLDMAIERMRRKYKVNVTTALPPVPYRETLRRGVNNIEGKHKKQTGGAGQFGVAMMNILPQPRDAGFEFVDKVKGGAIPRQLIPSVEKGIVSRMESGFLAGYPIIDIKVEVVDGKYHPVDSKDVAFQMAGSKGLRAAFEAGGTVLLEPIMDMEIVVPTSVMGDVMGDMTGRRGRINGMEPKGRNTVIRCFCPQAELQRYAPDLKGMSAGKGSFTMTLHGYDEVPGNLVDQIVAHSPFKRDDEDE